jgi:hypothetical protein
MDKSDAGKKGFEKTKEQLVEHRERQKQEAQAKYAADPKICPNCERVLPYEERYNQFCNQSCAASYNNRGVARNAKHPSFCSNCAKPKEKRHNKYCDSCIREGVYNVKKNLEEYTNDRGRRGYLIRTREHRCQVCQLTEWMDKPMPLELDHIDGNPDHNAEENLRLICPNCHAQTETYKGKGIEYGHTSVRKTMRRNRYKDGKTY